MGNEAVINHCGYAHDEFLSMILRDIRPAADIPLLPDDVAHTTKAINQARTWRHVLKNGEIIQVEIVSHTSV